MVGTFGTWIHAEASYSNQLFSFPIKTTRTIEERAHSETEHALIRRAVKHDKAAFTALYDCFVDRIHRYIYYKVGNYSDAEDLTAQVFMRAWEAISSYRITGRPFSAWLYRIAHNLVVDHFRRQHASLISLEETVPSEEPRTDFEYLVEMRLDSQIISRALQRLTHDQQQVILLRFIEGYSVAEVALMMQRSNGAIRTLQHRALTALNHSLHSIPEGASMRPSRLTGLAGSRRQVFKA